jgi:hypothetical protein
MATQPQVTVGSSRQRLLVAALAGVLVLILGLLVVWPLLRSRTEQAAAPPAVTAAAAPATPQLINPSTTVAGAGGAVGQLKDPFRPLVAAGAAAATAEAGVTPTTIAATQSTVPGAGAGTATTPAGGATAEHKVTLVSVDGGKAKVTVDGTSYTVEEGESFAGDYRVVDIGTACATFESGTTPFTLCEGEAVLK